MPEWTPERVVALSPDSASASAGQALATVRKWSALGRSDRAIWGLCQGSGKTPYQSRVDLAEPAFKCSCPSRKFPCKHGLALLLLFAKDAASLPIANEPDWVAEWIDGRSAKAQKKVERTAAAPDKPVDAESQARRAAQREARVRDGVAGCRTWLEDLVRRGLAAAQSDTSADWERTAARLVDAQAPGLASYVRRIAGTISSGSGWDIRATDLVGQLHLLLCAAERLDQLPPDLAGDVRVALGWSQSRDEALGTDGVHDCWTAIGQVIDDDERFRVARTWLVGHRTRRRALILEFAAGGQPLERAIAAGSVFDGELRFYPSRMPLRAIVATRSDPTAPPSARAPALDESVDAGLRGYAEALASNPWLTRWPLVLAQARVLRDVTGWFLVDDGDLGLPLRASFTQGLQLWRLVAATGGGPATVVTEWNGTSALPIALLEGAHGGYLDLSSRWPA
jgi:hypothetical protein